MHSSNTWDKISFLDVRLYEDHCWLVQHLVQIMGTPSVNILLGSLNFAQCFADFIYFYPLSRSTDPYSIVLILLGMNKFTGIVFFSLQYSQLRSFHLRHPKSIETVSKASAVERGSWHHQCLKYALFQRSCNFLQSRAQCGLRVQRQCRYLPLLLM